MKVICIYKAFVLVILAIYLLIDSHGCHGIAGVWVKSKNIKDAATVDQEPVFAQNQYLGWVQGATGEASGVDVAEGGGQLDKNISSVTKIFHQPQKYFVPG